MKLRELIEGKFGKRVYFLLLHVISIVLGIQVYSLSRSNQELKEALEKVVVGPINIGDYFTLEELEPVNTTTLPDTSIRSLVFLFNASCSSCKENRPIWNVIARKKLGGEIAIIGISLDTMERTVAQIADTTAYSVYVPKDVERFKRANNVTRLPQTIIRGGNGRVEMVLSGIIENQAELSSAISANIHN